MLALAPLFVISNTFDSNNAILPVLAMPIFSLAWPRCLSASSHSAATNTPWIATGAARDTSEESAAWIILADARRSAFLAAGLPTWIGALAVFAGLETVPLLLLGFSSLVVLYLYRLLRQLS